VQVMADLSLPARRFNSYLRRARSDSLVRNSLYLMASTVVTSGLGYVFWVVAAHTFTSREVGISGAIISLCLTTALLTSVGPFAMLIERLPANEGSSAWTATLVRMCVATALITALATAIAVPILRRSPDYRAFFNGAPTVIIAIVGAAAWTLVYLLGGAFIAARRAGRLLLIQTLVSGIKVILVFPLAAAGGAGLIYAWVASALLGVGLGAAWLVPGMRLGRTHGYRPHRRAELTTGGRQGSGQQPRHRRPSEPNTVFAQRLLGQHLTSVGGAVTPLILPVLVVLRLGVTANAYFYITELLGAAFFTVSPSVAAAVFAEGVRAHSDLRSVVAKALRVIMIMLAPPMTVMIVGGRLVLGLFGARYAAAGYGLLILLAIAALPDAVSNVAVAVFRVTHKLKYSTALNLGILCVTAAGAWVLMPRFGLEGVGIAWLAAQTLGAIASLPAYRLIRGRVPSDARSADRGDESRRSQADAGIEQLIDLAKMQSLDWFGSRLP
jgi:O-antigen/teichoic acid export membrane protein